MKKYTLLLALFLFTLSNLFAQSNEIKKVTYVKTEIDIPLEYSSKNEFSIENNKFSAEWIYLPAEIIEQDLGKEIFKQLEGQVDYDKMVDIEFISNGNKFSGKKYTLKGKQPLKYMILGLDTVDGQPLILNMGFKVDPKSNNNLDELMRRFILFER